MSNLLTERERAGKAIDMLRFEYRKASTLGYPNIASRMLFQQTKALIELDRVTVALDRVNKNLAAFFKERGV